MRTVTMAIIAASLLLCCHCDKPVGSESPASAGGAATPTSHPRTTAGAAAAQPTEASNVGPGTAPPRSNVARYRLRKQNLTDAELAKWLAKLPEPTGPTSLDVRDNQLTSVAVDALAKSKLGSIEVLMLSGNPIDDTAAQTIAAGTLFQNTRILWMADTKLSASGVGALLGTSSKLVGLRQLNLNGNSLGDAGVEVLAKAEKAQTLSHLYLAKIGMSDRGAKALSASVHLTVLEHLDVTGNALTKAGIAALKRNPRFAKTTVDVDAPAP